MATATYSYTATTAEFTVAAFLQAIDQINPDIAVCDGGPFSVAYTTFSPASGLDFAINNFTSQARRRADWPAFRQADTFIFRKGDSADWILDFKAADGDKLKFEGLASRTSRRFRWPTSPHRAIRRSG